MMQCFVNITKHLQCSFESVGGGGLMEIPYWILEGGGDHINSAWNKPVMLNVHGGGHIS